MKIRGWLSKNLKDVNSKQDGIGTLEAVMLAGLAAVVLFFIIWLWNEWKPVVTDANKKAQQGIVNDKPNKKQ